jgi:hypothetical protein
MMENSEEGKHLEQKQKNIVNVTAVQEIVTCKNALPANMIVRRVADPSGNLRTIGGAIELSGGASNKSNFKTKKRTYEDIENEKAEYQAREAGATAHMGL